MDSPSLSAGSLRERRPSSNAPRLHPFGSLTPLEITPTKENKEDSAVDDSAEDHVHAPPVAHVARPALRDFALSPYSFSTDAPETPRTDDTRHDDRDTRRLTDDGLLSPISVVRQNRRAAAAYLSFFSCGWADGSTYGHLCSK